MFPAKLPAAGAVVETIVCEIAQVRRCLKIHLVCGVPKQTELLMSRPIVRLAKALPFCICFCMCSYACVCVCAHACKCVHVCLSCGGRN